MNLEFSYPPRGIPNELMNHWKANGVFKVEDKLAISMILVHSDKLLAETINRDKDARGNVNYYLSFFLQTNGIKRHFDKQYNFLEEKINFTFGNCTIDICRRIYSNGYVEKI